LGRQTCGQTTTFTNQGQPSYVLFVAAVAEQTGCGTPGAQVTFTVNGIPAGSAPWKSAAVGLDLRAGNGSAASPSSTSVAGTVTYHAGWNLVSAPAGTVITGAQSPLFTLQPGDTNYQSVPSSGPTQLGYGYWALFSKDTQVTLGPGSADSYSLELPAGQFVMIGNPSGSRPVTVTGADSVYTFDPLQNRYSDATTLQPGQGAWAISYSGDTIQVR
jgi:hypothetical protein